MNLPAEYIGPWEKFRPVIRQRLAEFASVQPEEYLFELLYCLLTPQSKAAHVEQAVEELRVAGFPDRAVDVADLLRTPDRYVRFHNQKAERVYRLVDQWNDVRDRLTSGVPSRELREWLVRNVHGLGWKEASHALRNIGHFSLAIIDRHVITHLVRTGTVAEKPRGITPRRYLELEAVFMQLADRFEMPLQEVDLLFWGIEEGSIRK